MRSAITAAGGRLREIRAPFVVAVPSGARVRARLRVSVQDALVLRLRPGAHRRPEQNGNRPSHGKRGRAFRRIVAGIPASRFRDRLSQMAYNKGLAVIAVGASRSSK